MSTGAPKRQRRRSTRVRRTTTVPVNDEPAIVGSGDETAREHYRREKARRAQRTRPPEHPLEQARRAYDALLAADAERAKGGRPKKMTATPPKKPRGKEEDADLEE